MTTSTRRAIILIGSLVAVLLVVALAVPTISRLIQTTDTVHHRLPSGLASLTLDGGVGQITVRSAASGEAPSARATVRSGLSEPSADATIEGDTALLTDTCRNAWWNNCSVDWSLVVQDGTTLAITSTVGDVTITETTGSLAITSDVGDISATGVESATVRITSSVGDVNLGLATPPENVQANSSTGDVTVTVPDDATAYRVLTDTSVGQVSNQLPSDPAGTRVIDVRTSVGDIVLRRG